MVAIHHMTDHFGDDKICLRGSVVQKTRAIFMILNYLTINDSAHLASCRWKRLRQRNGRTCYEGSPPCLTAIRRSLTFRPIHSVEILVQFVFAGCRCLLRPRYADTVVDRSFVKLVPAFAAIQFIPTHVLCNWVLHSMVRVAHFRRLTYLGNRV